uniref:Uncharacterized protein n=1 Tax=Monomastix sp. (strain OKE-1) TaxID=141716 RepID=U5YET8_MONSK|nr:hypothetical protein [Monomastix sp. OKE-1]AGZ90227.1 hypothetical protein [Monomastix sp. OKE-1]
MKRKSLKTKSVNLIFVSSKDQKIQNLWPKKAMLFWARGLLFPSSARGRRMTAFCPRAKLQEEKVVLSSVKETE